MDKLLKKIGYFGRFQKMIMLIIGTSSTLMGLTAFMSVFNNAVPVLYCQDKKKSFQSNNTFLSNACEIMSNITMSKENNQYTPYECHYDTTYYGITIVTEWNLICNRLHLATLTQTVYMIGSFSSVCVGYFSDRYGRKRICVLMSIILSVTLLLCELFQLKEFGFTSQTKYIIYLITQYITGFAQFGLEISVFILFIEMAASKFASYITIFFQCSYSCGGYVIVASSYLLRNWHYQNMFIAGYTFVNMFLIMFFLPESPRFLISKKYYKKAADVLTKISKFNGNEAVSEGDILHELKISNEIEETMEKLISASKNELVIQESFKSPNVSDDRDSSASHFLFNPIRNLINLLLLAHIWFTMSMCYFGMNYGITSISENYNPYVLFILSSLAETIGYGSGFKGTNISRRKLLIIYLLTSVIPLILVAVIPPSDSKEMTLKSALIILFAFVGKILISASLSLVWQYSPQIYPTKVRNTLISFVSCVGRFGSLFASQIGLLKFLVWGPLPYYLFAGNAILGSISMFILPNEKSIKHL